MCDGASAACPADALRAEGAACDDGDACTAGEACRAGACGGGAAITCAETECGGTRCDRARGCLPKADGTACDDRDAATGQDRCYDGACRGYPEERVAQIAGGARHTLLRLDDGSVWAMGADDRGQLGDGASRRRTVPGRVQGLPPAVDVAAGGDASLAATSDGGLFFWGELRLPDGRSLSAATPQRVAGPTGVVRVAASRTHLLAVTSAGELWTAGDNTYGALGREDGGDPLRFDRARIEAVAQAAAGPHFTVASSAGTVWAWGNNSYGVTGAAVPTVVPVPTVVAGAPVAAELAAGEGHVLARATDGTLWSWGRNDGGQLGDGTTTSRPEPRRVASLAGVTRVAAGPFRGFALGSRGELWGWGRNATGELGRLADFTLTPTRVPGLPSVDAVGAGERASLAYVASAAGRRLWAFGDGAEGQLGGGFPVATQDDPATVVGFGRNRHLVIEQNYDTRRTGANLRETALTVANVRPGSFGRAIPDLVVRGQVYAQPLFVAGAVRGRDALYVATERNYLYAFDATTGESLWPSPAVFDDPVTAGCGDCTNISPYVGITSTPAIDLATGTIYVVAKVAAPTAGPTFYIHAVDMVTGALRSRSAPIAAVLPGCSSDSTAAGLSPYPLPPCTDAMLTVRFQAAKQYQRPGLLLQDGLLYVAFGGTCDQYPYHGWLMTYDAATLAPRGTFITTHEGARDASGHVTDCPRFIGTCPGFGYGGGVWQGGRGLASTGTGDVFFTDGNAISPAPLTPAGMPSNARPLDLSNAVMRVSRGREGALTLTSWFTQSNYEQLDDDDDDLGSGGVLLVPGIAPASARLITGGKEARLLVLRPDDLGGPTGRGISPTDDGLAQPPVDIPGRHASTYTGNIHIGPVFWRGRSSGAQVYVLPEELRVMAFRFDDATGQLAATPTTAPTTPNFLVYRSTLAVSADGDADGTGVLWGTGQQLGGVLFAYDAANVAAGPIWNSNGDAADALGTWQNYGIPTVANGRVYVPVRDGDDGRIAVYGLRPVPRAGVAVADPCTPLPPPPTTWDALYRDFLAPTPSFCSQPTQTAGHCQNCHHPEGSAGSAWNFGTTGDDLYRELVARRFVSPGPAAPSSPLGCDPRAGACPSGASPIFWVSGGRMPLDHGPTCDAPFVAAIRGWLAAGGCRRPPTDGTMNCPP
ncbi:MAG: hypothetical protein U0324_27545 [Polyangiales bacterium]